MMVFRPPSPLTSAQQPSKGYPSLNMEDAISSSPLCVILVLRFSDVVGTLLKKALIDVHVPKKSGHEDFSLDFASRP
jgi:hypothetical protein